MTVLWYIAIDFLYKRQTRLSTTFNCVVWYIIYYVSSQLYTIACPILCKTFIIIQTITNIIS